MIKRRGTAALAGPGLGLVIAVLLAGLALAQAGPLGPFTPPIAPKPSAPPVPGLARESEAQAMARNTPGPQPTRSRYATRTAADVLANIPSDPFYQRIKAQSASPGPLYDPRVASGTLGAPVFVRALIQGMPDYWVVPVVHEGRPVALFAVGVDSNGQGAIGGFRGWPYETFPAIPEAEARVLAGASGDPVTTAELVWGQAPRRPSDMLSPFWRLVRTTGAEFYLFQDRLDRVLLPAAEVEVR